MNELISGLRGLERGALVNLASFILALITSALTLTVPLLAKPDSLLLLLISILVIFALIVIGYTLYLDAAGHLKRYDGRLGVGWRGMIVQLAGITLFLLSSIITLVVAVTVERFVLTVFLSLALLSLLLIVVGSVMFGVMLTRLADISQISSGFESAGILYIVGSVLIILLIGAVIWIIATALIYLNARSSLKEIHSI